MQKAANGTMIKKREELRKLVKKHKAIFAIVEATKEKGLKKGKGYSYDYVRQCLVYLRNDNLDIIETAIEVIEGKLAEEAEAESRIINRIDMLLAS